MRYLESLDYTVLHMRQNYSTSLPQYASAQTKATTTTTMTKATKTKNKKSSNVEHGALQIVMNFQHLHIDVHLALTRSRRRSFAAVRKKEASSVCK